MAPGQQMENSSWVASGPHSVFAFALRTEKEREGGKSCVHILLYFTFGFFVLFCQRLPNSLKLSNSRRPWPASSRSPLLPSR